MPKYKFGDVLKSRNSIGPKFVMYVGKPLMREQQAQYFQGLALDEKGQSDLQNYYTARYKPNA